MSARVRSMVAGIAGAALIALLIPVGAAAVNRLPVVPVGGPDGRQVEVRPSSILYTLTSSYLAGPRRSGRMSGRLRWRRWTRRQALGSGYDWIPKRCPVICPGFGYNLYAARIRLYRAKQEHGYFLFTRMTLTFEHNRPASAPRRRTLYVVYMSGGFTWGPMF